MAPGITIFAAGAVGARQIRRALALAPRVVAADGGLRHVVRAGLKAERVIGDLDSARSHDLAAIPADRVERVADQDTTDFEKCLARIDAPFAIALGLFGSRPDHGLAAVNALVRFRRFPVIALAGGDALFACPRRLGLALPTGTRLSLFPMAPVRGRSQGLRWPIDGIPFAPDGRIGTSNETVARHVRLAFDGAGMVAILPARHLAAVVAVLGSQPPP